MIHLKNKTVVFCCLFVLTIFGCKSTNRLNSNDIEGLKFGYLPKGINTAHAISDCDDILLYAEVLKDTVVTDVETISNFIKLINELEESNNSVYEDYRIICLIFVKNSTNPKRICFGEGWLINYEGIIMKDEAKLFNFLDALLYPKINVLNN